jgi:hypothetical protein
MIAVICPHCRSGGALDPLRTATPAHHKKGNSHDCLFSFGGRSGGTDCSSGTESHSFVRNQVPGTLSCSAAF